MADVGMHERRSLSDDPLDSQLTLDDLSMLVVAAVAVICAAILFAWGV